MKKEEWIEFEKDLKQNGYKNYSFYKNADYNYFKSFGKSNYEEDRCSYQVAFLIYDFSKYNNIDKYLKDSPVNIQPMIMVSRTIGERIDLEILLDDDNDIKRVEELAESFYKWVEDNIKIPM